jgi:hypothetical protein
MLNRPENTAALVNGLLVLVVPLAFLVVGGLLSQQDEAGRSFRAPGTDGMSDSQIVAVVIAQTAMVLLPFASLAAWRTRVYARRWHDRDDRGWKGVVEASGCGSLAALAMLAPGIITPPSLAGPYIVVYGGAGLILGLLVGLILRFTAIVTLMRYDQD